MTQGTIAQRLVLLLAPRAQPDALGIGGRHVGQRPDMQIAGRAVDNDRIARIGNAGCVIDLADRRDAERTRNDGNMGVRAALFEHEAAQPLAIVVEQRRRAHGAGNDDGILRQVIARRRMIAAGKLLHQAIGKIVEIVQPLAQKRIGLAQQAGARVGLHTLDRRLRGQAGHHRFFELVHPAAVIGEHPIGFEHLAMLAAIDHVAVFDKSIEIGLQRFDRRARCFNSPWSRRRVIVDDDARLMQHYMAEPNAVAERGALDVHRPARRQFVAGRPSDSSPEATISASTMAVVWSASTSSSE